MKTIKIIGKMILLIVWILFSISFGFLTGIYLDNKPKSRW